MSYLKRHRTRRVPQSMAMLGSGQAPNPAGGFAWAAQEMEIDTFVIYTDSETWAAQVQPVEALEEYRRASGIAARLVVGMVSNGFSNADPNDPGMLDVVGFDTAAPQLVSDFARGAL